MQAGASVAGGAAASVAGAAGRSSTGPEAGSTSYFVDSLFRKENSAAATEPDAAAPVAETTRILLNSLRSGALPADDTRYLGQVIAQRTGLSQPDAEKRVSDTYARMQARLKDAETAAREAADKARKATVHATLWLFVSLLAGAFVASLAATWGGRQRDL